MHISADSSSNAQQQEPVERSASQYTPEFCFTIFFTSHTMLGSPRRRQPIIHTIIFVHILPYMRFSLSVSSSISHFGIPFRSFVCDDQ
jgi:hypothetical protein